MKIALPPKTQAALTAAAHSTWITGIALAGGLVTAAAANAQSTGQPVTLGGVAAYAQSHWLFYTISQLIAPTIRGGIAFKQTPAQGATL